MTRFDRIAVVDWSAASSLPRQKPQADAIWIGLASAQGVATTYHPSRHSAEQAIGALIAQTRQAGESLLIGVDFALGSGVTAAASGVPDAVGCSLAAAKGLGSG